MKKFILGFSCGIALTATTAVYASDTVQAIFFPVKYVFNGQNKELNSEYTTLNYHGHAYVPVRFVVENMGGEIRYDESSKNILINYIDQNFDSNKLTDIYRNLKNYQKEIEDKNQLELTYSKVSENNYFEMTFRKLHFFENPLSEEEVDKIRGSIYEIVGLRFPLVLHQFLIKEEPDIEGMISKIDLEQNRVLISGKVSDSTKKPEEAWVTLTKDAKIILKTDPDSLKNIEDLQLGQTVGAWFVGAKYMTDPAQVAGVKIQVIN